MRYGLTHHEWTSIRLWLRVNESTPLAHCLSTIFSETLRADHKGKWVCPASRAGQAFHYAPIEQLQFP